MLFPCINQMLMAALSAQTRSCTKGIDYAGLGIPLQCPDSSTAFIGCERMILPCSKQLITLPCARRCGVYNEVKRASDSFLGMPSQCFVTRKASIGVRAPRGRPQYCSNIAMKVGFRLRVIGVCDSRLRFDGAALACPGHVAVCIAVASLAIPGGS